MTPTPRALLTAAPRTAQGETEVVLRLAFERSPTGLWFCLSHEDPKIFVANESLAAIVDDLPNVLRQVFSLPALSPQAGVDEWQEAVSALKELRELVWQVCPKSFYDSPLETRIQRIIDRSRPASKEAAE